MKKNRTKNNPSPSATIVNGKLSTATWLASPNFNERPLIDNDNTKSTKEDKTKIDIDTIVIHNISLPPDNFGQCDDNGVHYVKAFFTNSLDCDAHPYFKTIEGIEVSAHLLIERDGAITQFVNFEDRAWHAGRSSYLGREAVNDFSIGIEMEGSDFQPFTDEQYQALASTIVAIYQAYPKTRRHLVGHSDIAPVRKTDPGEHFDWVRLRKMVGEMVGK